MSFLSSPQGLWKQKPEDRISLADAIQLLEF